MYSVRWVCFGFASSVLIITGCIDSPLMPDQIMNTYRKRKGKKPAKRKEKRKRQRKPPKLPLSASRDVIRYYDVAIVYGLTCLLEY
jgi:hypothetical protein